MPSNYLSIMDPGLVSRAVVRLEKLDVIRNHFTDQQVEAIFIELTKKSVQLKEFNISGSDLSSLDPYMVARAVSRIEQVWMLETMIGRLHCKAIFSAISKSTSSLKRLNISYNNLSMLDPGLLARAVYKLEEVYMTGTKLTLQQGQAIFTVLVEGDCKVKKLDVRNNNLSKLDPALLARAVNRMEQVEF